MACKILICIFMVFLIQEIKGNRYTEEKKMSENSDSLLELISGMDNFKDYMKYFNNIKDEEKPEMVNTYSYAITDEEAQEIHKECVNYCVQKGKCEGMTDECKMCVDMTSYDYWPQCSEKCTKLVSWDDCYKCDGACEERKECILKCENEIDNCSKDTELCKDCTDKECKESCKDAAKCKKCLKKCYKEYD